MFLKIKKIPKVYWSSKTPLNLKPKISSLFFIKWDESEDDKWLLLIYIKNNSPNEGIIIEDKTNQEKNISHEFKSSEIFKASDLMVDSLTQLISKIRKKKQA